MVSGPLRTDAVFRTVVEIVSDVCGIDQDELLADRRIADLDIDSMTAGEIVAQVEDVLHVDIDFRRIADDWSGMTLGQLAAQFVHDAQGTPRQTPGAGR
jgi:acyl carrier protein